MDRARAGSSGHEQASSSQLQAYARRTLDFLRLIETTLSSLEADTNALHGYTKDLHRVTEGIAGGTYTGPIDEDGRICDLLQQTAEAALRLHRHATRKCDAAREDPVLVDDDGVVDAYCEFLTAIADYHNASENLRDTIATLDALYSPVVGSFTNVNELFKALDV